MKMRDLEIRVYAMGQGETANEFALACFDSADFFDVQLLRCNEDTGEHEILEEHDELTLDEAGAVSDQLEEDHPGVTTDWIEYS